MEKQFKLDFNGQQVQQADFALIGETSALADDRVLAELFRMTPYFGSSVSKGIIRYGHQTSSYVDGLVTPGGPHGTVLVAPFRAVIGSRTASATNTRENWRDIRSGISVTDTDTTYFKILTLAANSSGNPRWDLVYAAVAVDADAPGVTRKVKETTSGVVSPHTVATYKRTTVTLAVLQGTPAASPVWPTITPDAGGIYYIPLAFIRVPNGFSSTSDVSNRDIALQAPIIAISPATGGQCLVVPNQNNVVSTAEQQAWGSSGNRKNLWVPAEMNGAVSMPVFIDYRDASSANWSHQVDGVIDSRDWRNRFCRWSGVVSNYTGSPHCEMPWQVTNTGGILSGVPGNFDLAPTDRAWGFGQSMNGTTGAPTKAQIATISAAYGNTELDGGSLSLYVDLDDSGKLKVHFTGANRACAFFWLDFTGTYSNK